ncbi:hypothetical protein PLESTB_001495400 [Pleodorina starrii]|uniref:Uncharacterized protein n=1 Tax=Pleodorina starrii TaxID=330485 RepID=A0A9W6BWI3_9CHLO|nr:hypothetical protein PLESTB_001495400 [Pleodorina starrii]
MSPPVGLLPPAVSVAPSAPAMPPVLTGTLSICRNPFSFCPRLGISSTVAVTPSALVYPFITASTLSCTCLVLQPPLDPQENSTRQVQDSVDAVMNGYTRAEGVTATVEEIPSRGQKLNGFRQILKVPVSTGGMAGADGATETAGGSSPTGGDMEMSDRVAGMGSPVRRVFVCFADKEADIGVARSAFIGGTALPRKTLPWVVGDNLTPTGRVARHAASRDSKALEAGSMRPRWRDRAQISVVPLGERVPWLYTAEH